MIAGQMNIHGRYPLWRESLRSLAELCDEMFLRFDTNGPAKHSMDEIHELCQGKITSVHRNIMNSDVPFNVWNWQEEMMRMLDGVHPEIVIRIDEDEVFEDGIKDEIPKVIGSGRDMAMFGYRHPMPTIDGALDHIPRHYPGAAHCKMFRWKPGLSFTKYIGYCRPTEYKEGSKFNAKTKIRHMCFFTPQMRRDRKDKLDRYILSPHPNRLMLGAGPMRRNGWVTLDGDVNYGCDVTASVPPLPNRITSKEWERVEMLHFIEHLYHNDAIKLCREIYEILEPGGILVTEQPNLLVCAQTILNEEKEAKGRWYRFGNHAIYGDVKDIGLMQLHKWGYTPKSMTEMLKGVGFHDVQIERARYHYPERDFRAVAIK